MNEAIIKISFESKLMYLPYLRKAVHGICSLVIENEHVLKDIGLCLNEALSNVIYHAYEEEPGHEIQVSVNFYSNEVEIQIIDTGLKNPKAFLDPQMWINFDPKDISSLPDSGRGLFIIHELMDKVDYTSSEGRNTLSLRKFFK